MSSLIVGKKFERQADEFACEMGNAAGIIDNFKHLQQKEQLHEDDFAQTYFLLQNNKSKISFFDYAGLLMRYHIAKTGHRLNNTCKWLYYNTFLGAHPSHQERIDAAERFLAAQQ